MKHKILADILSRKPANTIYHYTTQEGLLGVIKNREIWATHTQYLNDYTEYCHAVELVRQKIQDMQRQSNGSAKDILQVMESSLNGNETINVCVCSFSEAKDSLSQWRAYGDDTSGFAIGFAGSSIVKITEHESQSFYLAPCLYSPREQIELVHALVEQVLEENIERENTGIKEDLPSGGNLVAYLHRYAPILKHSSFAEEREWRIISRPLSCKREKFEYRAGNSMIIPYYRVPLDEPKGAMQISEVIIGPTPHPEQSKRSVTSLLVSKGFKDVPVNLSLTPYRNW